MQSVRGHIEDGKVADWQVTIKLGFRRVTDTRTTDLQQDVVRTELRDGAIDHFDLVVSGIDDSAYVMPPGLSDD